MAHRNVHFNGPCQFPLTNSTTSNGNLQITITATPNTGTAPSLTALPDVEVAFDDADSSWFNVWNGQTGKGTTFSVALNQVPLAASQTRTLTRTIQPGSGTLTVQFAATLTDGGGNVLLTNGGSCSTTAPVIP